MALGVADGTVAQVSIQINKIIQVEHSRSSTCQGLRDVLSGLTDASADNRYLVRLEPGVFTCGDSPLVVPAGVTVAGFGRELTTIAGTVDSPLLGVVHLVSDTTLRSLTVDNTQSSGMNAGIAVSAFALGAPVNGIWLQDVHLDAATNGPKNFTILAIDAGLVVERSLLALVSLEDSIAFFQFSRISAITNTLSTAYCTLSYNVLNNELGSNCLP